ncbi:MULTISPECIES: hypothetical protein [Anaerolinea]|nr:hypothetical protein [Anaerolinea thermophila]
MIFRFDHRQVAAVEFIRWLFEHYAIADIEVRLLLWKRPSGISTTNAC